LPPPQLCPASKTQYLLKDIYLLKIAGDIQRNHKTVDYTKMIEEENNVTLNETVACAGGACSII
jgi:hypothetical protein